MVVLLSCNRRSYGTKYQYTDECIGLVDTREPDWSVMRQRRLKCYVNKDDKHLTRIVLPYSLLLTPDRTLDHCYRCVLSTAIIRQRLRLLDYMHEFLWTVFPLTNNIDIWGYILLIGMETGMPISNNSPYPVNHYLLWDIDMDSSVLDDETVIAAFRSVLSIVILGKSQTWWS